MPREAVGRESDKFMLRLPEGMRERIRVAAEQSGRSMNAEIVQTLEEKYPTPFDVDKFSDDLDAAIENLKTNPSEEAVLQLLYAAKGIEELQRRGVRLELRRKDGSVISRLASDQAPPTDERGDVQ